MYARRGGFCLKTLSIQAAVHSFNLLIQTQRLVPASVSSSPRAQLGSKEHLNAQGVAMWPAYSGSEPFPTFAAQLPPTVAKRIAGNVTWLQLRRVSAITTSRVCVGL